MSQEKGVKFDDTEIYQLQKRMHNLHSIADQLRSCYSRRIKKTKIYKLLSKSSSLNTKKFKTNLKSLLYKIITDVILTMLHYS